MRRLTSIWVLMFDGPATVTSELELDDDMLVWLVDVCYPNGVVGIESKIYIQ